MTISSLRSCSVRRWFSRRSFCISSSCGFRLDLGPRLCGVKPLSMPACRSRRQVTRCERIFQYKMSMKRAVWAGRFPIQDEHEIGEDGVGVARPDASAHEECREPEPGTDSRICRVERSDRVQWVWAEREVCL